MEVYALVGASGTEKATEHCGWQRKEILNI